MKNDSTLQERPKSMMQGRYDTLFKAASFAGMTRKQQESYMRWLQIIQDNWSAELYAKRILTRTLSDAYTNTISPVFNLRRRDYKYIQKKRPDYSSLFSYTLRGLAGMPTCICPERHNESLGSGDRVCTRVPDTQAILIPASISQGIGTDVADTKALRALMSVIQSR